MPSGQCRRTIAGLTARDKPVPTPIGLRGLRDQRPSAKLSDSALGLSPSAIPSLRSALKSLRFFGGYPSTLAADYRRLPFLSKRHLGLQFPRAQTLYQIFGFRRQPTRSPPMRSPSPPPPAAHFTCRPRQTRPSDLSQPVRPILSFRFTATATRHPVPKQLSHARRHSAECRSPPSIPPDHFL